MENREVIFSKDSGIIDSENLILTLSKSEQASDYDIRYTMDGSIEGRVLHFMSSHCS